MLIFLYSKLVDFKVSIFKLSQKLIKYKQYTFTKKWVSRLSWFVLFSTMLVFAYAIIPKFGANEYIVEYLCDFLKLMWQVYVPAFIGYLFKSFFETKEEENLKFKRDQLQINNYSDELSEPESVSMDTKFTDMNNSDSHVSSGSDPSDES